MARLHEYQGKAILAANGVKIPRGRAASTADEAVAVFKELAGGAKGSEVVVKIQAWTTGRAGIGGVMFAKRPDDVRGHAALPAEEFANKDSELLACDVECRLAGVDGFYLELDIPGLGELIGSGPAPVEKK